PELRREVLAAARSGALDVVTDLRASPTGYPFKVVVRSEPVQERSRVCDLGYLRTAYRKVDGHLGYRCSAEPVDSFIAKGGAQSETTGRQCLCNALLANAGRPQLLAD